MKHHTNHVDVLVVGGGTAGTIAAIQAGRAGSKTAVVEMNGQLGGTLTTGGVSAPAYFWSRERQIIAGIGWELVLRCKELDGTPLPAFEQPNPRRPSYHVGLNPRLYALLAEEAALEAGVEIYYHEIVTGIEDQGNTWSIETVGKGQRRTIHAREVIDCTGDADLVGMLGLPRQRGEVRQPGTLIFRLGGYDPESLDVEVVQEHYTLYFVDVHTEGGVEQEFVADGRVPTIPLGALVPRGSSRLLVAGRCVSSDRLAHSALRVEASCMAMGQAAGAAAALGARRGIVSRDVPIGEIHALLREHGAIVPHIERSQVAFSPGEPS